MEEQEVTNPLLITSYAVQTPKERVRDQSHRLSPDCHPTMYARLFGFMKRFGSCDDLHIA